MLIVRLFTVFILKENLFKYLLNGCTQRHSFHTYLTVMLVEKKELVAQLCLNVCNPIDCSLPGISVYGILQARIVEWVAISYSRVYSQTRDQTQVSCIVGRFFTTEPPGKAHFPTRVLFNLEQFPLFL